MNVVKIVRPKSAPVHPRKPVRPHITISGRSLAHATRGASERARLAAAWVNGDLDIVRPTIRLAAAVFNVSVPTINAVLETIPKSSPESVDIAWNGLYGLDRDQFVRAHADEILLILDRITSKAA
jgi:hypothetical protein